MCLPNSRTEPLNTAPSPFARRLSLRIWLAVVVGMAVLTLAVGWAWRVAVEENSLNQPTAPGREMVLRGPDGQAVVRGYALREPGPPGEGINFRIQTDTGEKYHHGAGPQAPARRPSGRAPRRAPGPRHAAARRPSGGGPDRTVAFWLRPPFGFVWMLGIMGVAVALGVYPIIRRLLLAAGSPAAQREEVWRRRPVGARARHRARTKWPTWPGSSTPSAERIETLVKSHKSLLANASHELRSPLTRIRMGLELMGGQTPSPTFRAEILRNIAELDQLVDEILLASRLDAARGRCGHRGRRGSDRPGRRRMRPRGRRPGRERRAPKGWKCAASPSCCAAPFATCWKTRAATATGEITVQVLRSGTLAEVRVCDRGPGVPLDQRERIFEPFYRLPGASERSGGVGLGLALVRSIAGRHNGSVHCEDHAGGGACFVLRLPLALAK